MGRLGLSSSRQRDSYVLVGSSRSTSMQGGTGSNACAPSSFRPSPSYGMPASQRWSTTKLPAHLDLDAPIFGRIAFSFRWLLVEDCLQSKSPAGSLPVDGNREALTTETETMARPDGWLRRGHPTKPDLSASRSYNWPCSGRCGQRPEVSNYGCSSSKRRNPTPRASLSPVQRPAFWPEVTWRVQDIQCTGSCGPEAAWDRWTSATRRKVCVTAGVSEDSVFCSVFGRLPSIPTSHLLMER